MDWRARQGRPQKVEVLMLEILESLTNVAWIASTCLMVLLLERRVSRLERKGSRDGR